MKILGIDHATNHAGWALFERGVSFSAYGPIDLTPFDHPETIHEMHKAVNDLIVINKPDVVVLEKPMALRNGKIARMLIEVYTACLLAAQLCGISVVEVTPQLAKKYTAGHAFAEKDDVARFLQAEYGLEFDDIAVPVYFKKKGREGEIKERHYDISDACSLCVAAWKIFEKDGRANGSHV